MKVYYNWSWKRWRLIPTIGVRSRASGILIAWLWASVWLCDTCASRSWSSKHFSVYVSHHPEGISSPTLEVGFAKHDKFIFAAILGFSLSIRFYFGEDADMPF